MSWFGIVRDDEAIAAWQRADAVRRAAAGPRRRAAGRAGRAGRWVGLPLVATTASVLAIIPGTLVPPTEAAAVARVALDVSPVGEDVAGIFPRLQDGFTGPDLSSDSQDDRAASPERGFSAAQGAAAVALLRLTATEYAAAAKSAALVGLAGPAEPAGPAGAVGASGIPVTVLAAYRAAQASIAVSDPACHLPWWLLAGIGRIESGHASGGRVTADGTTRGRILGPRLDGQLAGTAVIRDTDGGALDGDPVFDRAVGPMQFLPGTWRSWGRDGNNDGVKNPSNVYDASLAAGAYLCAGGRDLSTDAGIAAAVLSYNYSRSYLDSVVTWGLAYRDGVTPTTDGQGAIPPPATGPTSSTPTTTRPTTSTPVPSTTGTPTSGTPTAGTPTSGTPTSSPPTSGTPTSGTPTTGTPTTGTPTTSPPTTGTPTCPTTTTTTTTTPPTTTTTSTPTTTTTPPTDPSCPTPTTSTSTTTTTTTTTSTSPVGIVTGTSTGSTGTSTGATGSTGAATGTSTGTSVEASSTTITTTTGVSG